MILPGDDESRGLSNAIVGARLICVNPRMAFRSVPKAGYEEEENRPGSGAGRQADRPQSWCGTVKAEWSSRESDADSSPAEGQTRRWVCQRTAAIAAHSQ